MSKAYYKFTTSIQEAVREAQNWFLARGCPWTGFRRRKNGKRLVPSKIEIKNEYMKLLLLAETHKSQSSESGELCVELSPLRYGYRAAPHSGEEGK